VRGDQVNLLQRRAVRASHRAHRLRILLAEFHAQPGDLRHRTIGQAGAQHRRPGGVGVIEVFVLEQLDAQVERLPGDAHYDRVHPIGGGAGHKADHQVLGVSAIAGER
jgi:hypothetical protein